MANGIYKVTMKLRFLGQAIVNTFWYRSVLEGVFASDLLIDGAQALGRSFLSTIWAGEMRDHTPTNLYCDGVSVMGYNDQFELLYNNTVHVAPNTGEEAGLDAAGENYLPLGNCANIAFYLKNRLISNPLFKPPSKGLVAFGPVRENWAGNDGTLNDAGMADLQTIADAMAEPLAWPFISVDLPFTGWTPSLGLPGAFIPMRAKTWQWDTPQIIGGVTVFKHIETTDIESAHVRKLLGYRRSRRVEG